MDFVTGMNIKAELEENIVPVMFKLARDMDRPDLGNISEW